MKVIIANREPLEVIDLAAQAGSIGPDELVAGVEYASGFTVTLNPPVPWRVIYSRHEIGQRVMQAIDALLSIGYTADFDVNTALAAALNELALLLDHIDALDLLLERYDD
jgi:hypothetical protein